MEGIVLATNVEKLLKALYDQGGEFSSSNPLTITRQAKWAFYDP